jgi:replicative DNA helicase
LEQLDPNEINGIEMHLYGDSVRLDVFKLQKGATIENNLVEEIFKKIAPALNLKYNEDEQIDNKREIKRIKRDYFFIGREDVFNKMDKILQTEKLVILQGLPGVGKTSCAIEYVLGRFHNELIKQYFVFYADEMYKIREDISQYCKQLNLCKDSDDFETKIINFKEFIAKSRDISDIIYHDQSTSPNLRTTSSSTRRASTESLTTPSKPSTSSRDGPKTIK